MAKATVTPLRHDAEQVSALLNLPQVRQLIAALDELKWTGRPGYGTRTMVGVALAKSVYAIPTWSRTVRLVAEHDALRAVVGGAPSADACYRFARKMREHHDLLDACLDAVVRSLAASNPDYGTDLSIDGSDMPAYANGQRFVRKGGPERERFSDPDATWGHRSAVSTRAKGGYYGYKLHAAVCTRTGLPVAWQVDTASAAESPKVPALLDTAARRAVRAATCALDKGYDNTPVYEALAERGIRPVIPLRKTGRVVKGEHKPPTCEHGTWTFAGADDKRGATKWRCPTAECAPRSVWIKADRLHPLIPRESERFRALYAGRGAVEREFGRLKHEWGLGPLRVRRLARVRLHADLTILARLASALTAARAVPRAA